MLWEEQNWPAIQAADKSTPVIIPLGSIEQHGRHLPVMVDTAQVDAIARRVESELADECFLLPTLWLGSSHHHLDFPGTVSVPLSLYSQMIKSIASCITRAGFTRLFFLNGHGGNSVPAAQALAELVTESDENDTNYLVLGTWWEMNRHAVYVPERGMETTRLTHACEYESSVMLALRPDLVSLPDAVESEPGIDNEWAHSEHDDGRVAVFTRFRRRTASGSMGRPGAATEEKGRGILDAVAGEVIRFVRDFATWPPLPVIGPR